MKLVAIISTFIGFLLTIAAVQQEQYLFLIGSVPLTVMGLILLLEKENSK